MIVQGRSGQWVQQEARDLAGALAPGVARLLVTDSILQPQAEAHAALASAKAMLEPSFHGMGVMAPEVKVPKDPEQLRLMQEQIDKVYENVEQSLQAIETTIRQRRKLSSLARATPFLAGVLLILAALGGFIWGVLRGSRIELFGASGGCAFLLVLGFYQIRRYNRDQLALDTLVARVRGQVATCRSTDLVATERCLRKALGTLDDYFKEIKARALI